MSTWADDYNQYRSWLTDQGVIFSFSGYLSEDMLSTLAAALKQRMALTETDSNVAKRVFSVFVEQVQNIIRYSSDRLSAQAPTVEMSAGMVSVGAEAGRFFVICGNAVDAPRVATLRERLEFLAGLDRDALRAYYRQKLREAPEADSLGASIGLIEIARRSSEPIAYDFVWMDEEQSRAFFCIKAFI
ncbi:hypothetical protein F1188_15600 [Roseospira marina]|uniref:Uncharacterized protein n=1 Tax=Roseospira marina TaxID=140057 RepID=A0A5M6I940_9PROT|nr:SiaB family protein kinase [Roseospira marina]KAA5604467.1 hypothetical protein F1188_15600 [Roseospira marina]MBB4315513.1 hypothetical protein [Roseospira marina]MBB5088550.1 hypothetical protein [Roseospira marina]